VHESYFRSITLCRKGNRLAVLSVLLYPPGNLDKTGLLEGIFIQFFDDTLPLIVEDEVVGNESFDDCCTRRISVIIDLILSGLGIFAQVRPNVVTESHDIKMRSLIESLHLLAVAI
jgi:hypothetical protein